MIEQSPDLKDVVLRLYTAVSQGDQTFFDQVVSKQGRMLMIGTAPSEWATDLAVIKQAFQAQAQAGIKIAPGDPQAYREGSVGWIADRPRLVLPDGTELPFRVTAIFHREDDAWKLVQVHNSIGIADEEAIGMARAG